LSFRFSFITTRRRGERFTAAGVVAPSGAGRLLRRSPGASGTVLLAKWAA
jgi:hypothetical protein